MEALTSVAQFEREASRRLSRIGKNYYNSGAFDELSLTEANSAFDEIRLKSAAEADASNFQGLQTSILGETINSPICAGSTAVQRIAHPEGEVASAKACQAVGQAPLILSSWSSSFLEDVAAAAPGSAKIYQVYMSKIMEVNEDIWKRCRENGFKALALTTDTQQLGKRDIDVRNVTALPKHIGFNNLSLYAKQTADASSKANLPLGLSPLAAYVFFHKDANIDWSLIPYMKERSGLKIIAKGIMTYADARLAIENGADALYVSSHGARQLDSTPATISILSEVVQAKKDAGRPDLPVYFDGGVRSGEDVLKALVLGADAVFLGRPILWGLAVGG